MREIDFVKMEVVPVLRRLGYFRIQVTHGPREKGRDIVFADLDRFGLVHYFAAQVKVGRIDAGGGGAYLRELLAQLQTAYEEPFVDAANGAEHRIAGVYLISDGRITEEARERLSGKTGQWLHFVDGDQLELARQRPGSFVSEEDRRARLLRLRIDLGGRIVVVAKGMRQILSQHLSNPGDLGFPADVLPVRSLERFLDVAMVELHPADISELVFLEGGLQAVNAVIAKLRIGRVEGLPIRPTIQGLADLLASVQTRAERALAILEGVEDVDRPLPGERLPRIGTFAYLDEEGPAEFA